MLQFGIAKATQIDKLGIHWRDGTKENDALSGVNRVFKITESQGAAEEPWK